MMCNYIIFYAWRLQSILDKLKVQSYNELIMTFILRKIMVFGIKRGVTSIKPKTVDPHALIEVFTSVV